MTGVTSKVLNKSYGNERRKRCIFKRLRKIGRDDVDVTWRGRSFQVQAAERGKLGRRQSTAMYGGPAVKPTI